jgi:hypothetical protein
VSIGRALASSLLTTLRHPATWALALASFLVRGGIAIFVLPIWSIPTPVGLANIAAPTITSFVFGGVSPSFIALVVAAVVAVLAWLLVGGWVAARLERELVVTVAADEEARPAPVLALGWASSPWRILAVRLVAYLPLAAAIAYASARIASVTYIELTDPSDVGVAVGVRVLRRIPDAVVNIAVAWAVGEIVGSLAARRIVLAGQSVRRALLGSLGDVVRRPITTLLAFALPTLALVAPVVPLALLAGAAWDALRVELFAPVPRLPVVLAMLLLFVSLWGLGLVVSGAVSAWRSAAWTVEVVRTQGTFGGSPRRRAGDWQRPEASGSV